MFKLAPYFAGAVAALVVMDFAPPVKSALDEWTGASTGTANVQAVNTVDRSLKGDRLVPTHPARFGSTTLVIKPLPADPAQKPVARGKVPIGCDPAFSPLAASASLNFAGRCVS